MRDIKFRGMTIPPSICNGMKPKIVYGTGILKDPTNTWLISSDDIEALAYGIKKHIVDSKTIGQYTGMKDKNGVEIYEGDVVEIKYIDGYTAKSTADMFELRYDHEEYESELEIIGNIHQ